MKTNIEKLADDFIRKRRADLYLEELSESLSLMFDNIDDDEQKYFCSILKEYQFLTRKDMAKMYADCHNKLLKSKNLILEECLFIPLFKKDLTCNNSFAMTSLYRDVNKLDKKLICFDTVAIKQLVRDANLKNIIIVDDFSGTGDSVIESLEFLETYLISDFERLNVYVILAVSTKRANKKMEGYFKKKRIKKIVSSSAKCLYEIDFSKRHMTTNKEVRKIIEKYEKLATNRRIDLFGYKQSDCVVSFFFNTPNNTLSSFSKFNKKNKWVPPFPRNNQERVTLSYKRSGINYETFK